MKKIINCFFLLHVMINYSQELNVPVATQYLADNPFIISPGYAGIGDDLRINLNGYKQWVGIENAPQNQSFYGDLRILDRSGVGLSLYNDTNGNVKQAGGKFTFAHHLILDYYSKQYLSFGISYIYNSFKIDISNSKPAEPDPDITDNRFTSNNNFEAGFLYRNKGFYFSANMTNILPKKLDSFTSPEPKELTNYQFYTGYAVRLENETEIEPSIFYQWYKSDGRSVTDLNLKYRKFNRYEDYYWAGISYRFLNDQIGKPLTIGPMIGFKKAYFTLGYSYQIMMNDLSQYNSGTHSISIGLRFFQSISNCPCTQKYVRN
ncbi:type IX secretion system membrane protein PorP/SprF [Flavobacterium sp. T12S277]|uniref:PorP/SprF family type IX secretion system membrane protein n=1 Tax=Flavobacterium sp. T12S277 TaxID=3402752 RepID=UPI003AE4B9BB